MAAVHRNAAEKPCRIKTREFSADVMYATEQKPISMALRVGNVALMARWRVDR